MNEVVWPIDEGEESGNKITGYIRKKQIAFW